MGKMILPFVAALVIGMSAATGFSLWNAGPAVAAPVPADSTKHDSTTMKHEAPGPIDTSAVGDTMGHGGLAALAAMKKSAQGDSTADKPPLIPTTPGPGRDGRLAKIFAAMAPKEAAKVLAQMD